MADPFEKDRKSGRYRKRRAEFIRRQGPNATCAECGGWVDVRLSGNLLDGPNVDHKLATADGGDFWDVGNWALVHKRCNLRKGMGPSASAPLPEPPPSRSCQVWRGGRWEPASPNGLGCDRPAANCPHDRALAKRWSGLEER